MSNCFTEPTVDELLADGLTQGLMQADRVDVSALKSMFQDVALAIRARPAQQQIRHMESRFSWTPPGAAGLLSAVQASGIQARPAQGAASACSGC